MKSKGSSAHKISLRVLSFLILLCVCSLCADRSALSDTAKDIETSIRSVYSKALTAGKKQLSTLSSTEFRNTKTGVSQCGLCTGMLLYCSGVTTKYIPGDGCDRYSGLSSSGAINSRFTRKLFPGRNQNGSYTIESVCNYINNLNTTGKMTYVAFCFAKGSTSKAGQKYGHALLVQCIYGGKVYYSEFNSAYRCESIKDFAKRYKDTKVNQNTTKYLFDGAIWFDDGLGIEEYILPLDDNGNEYWKTAQAIISIFNSPFDKSSSSTIAKGYPVVIKSQYYNTDTKTKWFVTTDERYIKESDVGKLSTFTKYISQGTGTKQCDINFTVRAKISLSLLPVTTGFLFNEPYANSIVMRKVDKSVNMKAVAVVKNKHNEFWVQVSLDGKTYYVCANCVTEVNSSAAPIQFTNPQVPSGDYKLSAPNIPLGGTISSRYSISSAYAFWRTADGEPIMEAAVPNIHKTSFGIKDKGGINDQLSYSTLKSRKGKGTYYYEIQVHYYKFKDVVDASVLPFEELTWPSDPYYFTVEGGSGEPIHGEVVSNVPVAEITLSNSSATIEVGANLFLSPTIKPENATNKTIIWSSSNESVATVKDGKITGVATGTSTITAKADDGSGKIATCTVTVIKKVTSITVSPNTITLYVNGTSVVQLLESIQPADASNKAVTWSSSNSNVVTVDQSGSITAKAVGTATITAKANDTSEKQGTCQVTVLAYVDTVTLSGSDSVNVGESIKLIPTISPASAENKALTWTSSDTNIATVDQNGYVTGVKAGGPVTITATASDRGTKAGIFSVTVLQPVTEISLSGTAKVLKGKTTTITASVLPSNASNNAVTWSSENASIATVNNGLVTGVAPGNVTIWASASDGSGVKTPYGIRVLQPVADIAITGEDIVPVDGSISLRADVTPSNADDPALSWTSSKPMVASVNSQGVVTGLQPGSAVITAASTDGSNISKLYNIQVVRQRIAVKIEGENLVHTGSTVQLTALVTSDEPLSDTSVTWSSSDPAVVTVNAQGVMSGISNGTAIITATSNAESYYSAEYQVTVDTLVSQITVTGTSKIDARNAVQLAASVEPVTATNKQLTWTSSNDAVASVDGDGKVQGLSAGTATISANAADGSGVKGTLTVTVYPLPNQINITGEADLLINTSSQLSVEVLPANVRDKNVTWSSSDTTVATVNANGLVTAKANGTAVITATAAGNTAVTAQYEITVSTRVSSIELNAPERINVGDMGTVGVTILPATATNKQVIWSSSDEDVAVVDASGNVFGLAGGNVIIKATTVDGSEVSAEVEIQIFQPIRSISVDIDAIAYTGNVLFPSSIILPEDASEPYVEWTSSNENILSFEQFTIDDEGELGTVCLQPGVVKITATATDGSGVSGCAYIQIYPYAELTRNTATYTVYTSGEANRKIGRISLTSDSAVRAAEDKYGAVWTIEHLSGDYAAAIGINERTYTYSNFNITNGVDLMLLGVNRTGSDTYRVTCTINGQADTCMVTINAVEPVAPLPDSVSLPTTTYSAMVGEEIAVNVTPVVSPTTSALPDDANPFLYGVDSFNRYARVMMRDDVFNITFSKAGVYTAYVRYEGANYQYDAYATFAITTPEGTVPPSIESLCIDNSLMYLLSGETAKFNVSISPANADESTLQWSSSDPDVVTIAADGTLTAIGTGTSVITVSAGNGVSTTGLVVVTDSLLSIDWDPNEIIEVYVGGESRTVIQKVYLSPRASAQLNEAPTWSIKRQSGNNLTLTFEPVTATSSNGELLYGCAIILKSVSNVGITEYELTCSDGTYSASTTLQVNANNIEDGLPSLVQWNNATFTGTVDQRMTIYPVVQCWPTDTVLPNEVTISIEGDRYWNAALKASDYTVSRGMITFAFSEPGVYTANCVYSCSNMRYLVPITVRVADSSGNVPVRLMQLTLNESEISIETGATFQLSALTAPMDATEKSVVWSSDNPDIAMVSSNGLVTGVSNGTATIWCTPSDTNCNAVKCTVVVENAFTITEYTDMPRQYLQGKTGFSVMGYELSAGTKARINAEGSSPTWSLSRVSGNSATVELQERENAQYIVVTGLLSGGTDVYEVTCIAGSHVWTGRATLEVVDLGDVAPESVTIAQNSYTAALGEEVELDFTPLCSPSNTSIPTELQMQYVRSGNLLTNLVDSYRSSVRRATGDKVKVAFKVPGTYLMSRSYSSCNLTYLVECLITVEGGDLDILRCDDAEPVVYIGGQSSIASTCYIWDTSVEELYGDEFVWKAERLSGDCLTVALRADQSSASLYVVNAKSEGTEVWRVSCTFRGITDSVDVTIHAVEPQSELPEAATLYQSTFDGMIGNAIIVPLAVQCEPDGTSLPTSSAEDWRFSADGNTQSHATWKFVDGQMTIYFNESGYYGGRLIYASGNVTYNFPLSFAVTDEESVQAVPEYIDLFISNDTVTVYPEGEANVSLVNAVLSDSLNMHSVSSISAYAERVGATWTVDIISGNACTLTLQTNNPASAQVILDDITGTGDVSYRVNCTLAGTTYSKLGIIHVAGDDEARPEPQVKNDYFTTATGTVLTIDASFYDRHSNLKLCSGADSIWENADALAAMGFKYEISGDFWQPTFYEDGVYTTTITNMIGNLKCSQDVIIVAYTERPLPESPSVFTLPRALQEIDAEAFANVNIHVVDLRGTSVTSIQARAFADNHVLMRVYIPASVTSISASAFEGCQDFVVFCTNGSYAESWAKHNRYPVIYLN